MLQLSSVELETELREALESNPLLELSDPDEQDGDGQVIAPIEMNGSGSAEIVSNGNDERGSHETHEELPYDEPMDLGLERSDYGGGPMPEDVDGMESQDQETEDLRDHLLWQLNLTPLSPRDRAIGATIIEAIDDDGYLHEANEVLQANLVDIFHVRVDEVEAMRHRIQHFDPIGIASRNLSECLRVQLDAREGRAQLMRSIGDKGALNVALTPHAANEHIDRTGHRF